MVNTKCSPQEGWSDYFQKKMASPAWTLPLAILAPVIFMWSKNWFMYNFHEISISFLTLFLACSLVYVTGKFIKIKIKERFRFLWRFMLCMLFLSVLLIFLELSLRKVFAPEYFWFGVISVYFVTVLFLYFIVTKHGFGLINVFLLFWLILSTGTGLYGAVSTVFEGDALDESERIELKKRPNIYLFILESYHDLKTMNEVYGIDVESLQSWLSSRDFLVHENVYSNAHATLLSMTNIFGMRLNVAQGMGNNDIEPKGRKLIGGGTGNQAYRILKENGYYTVYLTSDTENPFYYFHPQGKYLDETDIDFGPAPGLRPLYDGLFPFINRAYDSYRGLKKDKNGRINSLQPKFRNKLIDNIRIVMEETGNKRPLFIGFKSGALHTPTDSTYTWKQRDEWVSGQKYQEGVKRGNQELIEIVDSIVEKDPSAVIVLLGDHGAWRLQGIWKEAVYGDAASLDALLRQHGESFDTFASDIYGTFLAIRMPEKGDISNGLPMSHVNLFRHIFAALTASPETGRAILERRVPSESGQDLLGFRLIKDGIVQHPAKP